VAAAIERAARAISMSMEDFDGNGMVKDERIDLISSVD
jgi:hypothetical protein